MKAISKKTGKTVVVKEIFENVFYDSDGNSYLTRDFDFIDKDDHWQRLREQVAIEAMKCAIKLLPDENAYYDIVSKPFTGETKNYSNEIAEFSVKCADALIEQLKK
jgi:hypothetical protein